MSSTTMSSSTGIARAADTPVTATSNKSLGAGVPVYGVSVVNPFFLFLVGWPLTLSLVPDRSTANWRVSVRSAA
jgi:hypothetical protein